MFQNAMTGIAARLRMAENTFLILVACVVGLATGAAVFLFRSGIEWFQLFFQEWLAGSVLAPIIGGIGMVVALALAGLIVGLIMARFVGEERHHGVAGILESVALAGGRLPYWKAPFKAVASALSLGAGASVGPEDPSVQIGANLGSWFGKRLRLREEHLQILVAAGAASAIAAAFKAPIAAVFFSLEVILNGAFETRSIGVVVLAAVISSAFTQAVEPGPEMGPFTYSLGNPLEILLFLPLGFLIGPLSALFTKMVYWQHDLWHHRIHLPRPIRTALAGALVGVVGLALPQIMGAGREFMNDVLDGKAQFAIAVLLALIVAKMLLTTVSMAGGFVGGIFAPSLFVGIACGALYGQLLQAALPSAVTTSVQAFAIAGMAACMGGVVRAPITAIMLVFELTNDYRLILPIMLVTSIAVFTAERLEPAGIYTLGLLRKGIRLPSGREIDLIQGVQVQDAMLAPAPTIPESASLLQLRDAFRQGRIFSLCVVDASDLLVGIVTLSDLQNAYPTDKGTTLKVGDICTRNPLTVYPDDSLLTAIRLMSANDIGRLPVVKRDSRHLAGFIGRHGVMRAYNIAMTRKVQDQQTAERIRLNALTGGRSFELHISNHSALVGKKLREIKFPVDCVVAAIERSGKMITPHGDTQIAAGDRLMMVAAPEVAQQLRDWAG
ncbi:MAG: chloride channel protein [Anaerolineae bacterium]|nr:chloride channel protein [Anaerolineae bacterium]